MPSVARLLEVTLPVAGLLGLRAWGRDRLERDIAARLGPPGRDGVIAGAEALSLAGGDRRVLLLHGFGDTPESMGGLARYLHERGWTVRVPLLPGHGRTVAAFGASTANEWLDSAGAAYADLAGDGRPVALVGQSMGAALAVELAADHPSTPALVLLAPLLSLTAVMERAARWWRLLALVRPVLDSADDRSIIDPRAREASRAYGALPSRLLPQLVALVRSARTRLPCVIAPTRVVQSRRDNRVTATGTEEVIRALGAREIDLIWRDEGGHVLSVDAGHAAVWALTADWLERHLLAPSAGASPP